MTFRRELKPELNVPLVQRRFISRLNPPHLILCLFVLVLGLSGCRTSEINKTATEYARTIDTLGRRYSDEPINSDWRFIRGDVPEASATEFDDASWDVVTLPHTWNARDGTDGGNNYYRGAGWYRRSIHASVEGLKARSRFYLRFGAASLVADVYVNGTHVGQHRGGFAAFCFDVTDQLNAGENVVAVRVDNTRVDDVAPLSGDFSIFGGLYRGVELLVLDPLHISPIDDASSGVFVTQSNVSEQSATIDVAAELRNTGKDEPHATVEVKILEMPDGKRQGVSTIDDGVVASTDASIEARSTRKVVTHVVIDHPKLWDGVRSPSRYVVYVFVKNSAGKIVDAVAQPIGLRSFAVDPDRGLILNGKLYAAHGVNVHQEVANKGWAGGRADYELNYRLIRELGANCVRMAHYQHNDIEYSLCDESGIVVWAEVPLVNEFGKSPAFADNVKQQLRELIKQNYNHPSILFWSLWNELAADPDDAHWQLVRDCNALAHELDPTRPTTAAHHRDPRFSIVNIPDVIAFNRYPGWYGGRPEDWGTQLDEIRAATPGRPIAISEYGAGASIAQHELHPARVEAGGPWHPEEYQSFVHEQAYRAMKARPWLWGTFVWAMFDFSADQRREGDHAGRNDKGLVTIDRKTKKDAFYFYQANWTSEPMVHITSSRYNPYPVGRSVVKVYSNCDKVELSVNGRSLGSRAGVDGIFVWPDVSFVAGPSTIVARGAKGDVFALDTVHRTVSDAASTRTTVPRRLATTTATTVP